MIQSINQCHQFLQCFVLVFHTVESVKLINIQNKHLAQSKYEKSLFMLENHYPSLLSPLPLPTSKNKINLKTLSCLLLQEVSPFPFFKYLSFGSNLTAVSLSFLLFTGQVNRVQIVRYSYHHSNDGLK